MTLPLRIELAMTFKAMFPNVQARDRSGHGYPEVSEAVSGCNILIWRIDASPLRPIVEGADGCDRQPTTVVIPDQGEHAALRRSARPGVSSFQGARLALRSIGWTMRVSFDMRGRPGAGSLEPAVLNQLRSFRRGAAVRGTSVVKVELYQCYR